MRTLPPEPLRRLADPLWVARAATTMGVIDRHMTVVRLTDGGVLLHDPLDLGDQGWAAVDAIGPVRWIVVPSWLHDFDVAATHARYRDARVVALPSTRRRLARALPMIEAIDATQCPRPARMVPLPGLRWDEFVLEVAHDGGVTHVYTDAIMNLPLVRGPEGWISRLAGSAGRFRMTPLGKVVLLADRAAFTTYIRQQADRTDVRHVIVTHGTLVDADVPAHYRSVLNWL